MKTLISILVLISFNLFAEEGEKLGQWTFEEIMEENKEKNSLEFLETIEEDKELEEYIYNNCILKKIKSAMSKTAAFLIMRSCRYKSKNPSWIDTKYYEWFVK